MPLAAPRLDAPPRRRAHFRRRTGAQHFFIDVALENQMRIVTPRLGQIVARAEADHFGARLGHEIKKRPFLDEKDARHAGGAAQNRLVL